MIDNRTRTVSLEATKGDLPRHLFLETTTRCNLKCRMCVLQTDAHGIRQGDLSDAIFDDLEPAFHQLDTLILSGIGEPLLHPQLERFVARARRLMPETGRIGFQTNGLLLDQVRIDALMHAGLSTICISMDAADSEMLGRLRHGADMNQIQSALGWIADAKRDPSHNGFQTGLEFVLMKDNLAQLPRVVRWAADHQVDYLIVTHALAYGESCADQTLYGINTDASWAFFREWRRKAEGAGIDPAAYFQVKWKYTPSAEDRRIIEFVERMIDTAYAEDIPFHLRQLLAEDAEADGRIESVFAACEDIAATNDLRLQLPVVRPRRDRQCEFVESDSAFIAWDGQVHPCYFLWHTFVCYQHGHRKKVSARSFGSLAEESLHAIWNSDAYRAFRGEVRNYSFPYCSNCCVGPCDLVYGDEFEADCHAIDAPCGDCPWCMGVLNCLR